MPSSSSPSSSSGASRSAAIRSSRAVAHAIESYAARARSRSSSLVMCRSVVMVVRALYASAFGSALDSRRVPGPQYVACRTSRSRTRACTSRRSRSQSDDRRRLDIDDAFIGEASAGPPIDLGWSQLHRLRARIRRAFEDVSHGSRRAAVLRERRPPGSDLPRPRLATGSEADQRRDRGPRLADARQGQGTRQPCRDPTARAGR